MVPKRGESEYQVDPRTFKAVMLPTLLYGSETWAPIATQVKCLQGFMRKCVRVIFGVSLWDKKRNTELRAEADLEGVEVMLMKRRLRWLGHVARMDSTRIPKCMHVGVQTRGGQKCARESKRIEVG